MPLHYFKLELGQPPTYDKSWAMNKEGGMDWTGNIYWVLLIAFVFVGLVLLYEGDMVDGLVCLGIPAVGLLVRYWLKRREQRSLVRAATAKPKA